ncbi:MAG: hypothetical protein PSV23_02480 [Brevundimonas sp.]|nr:hypothetical protein [Brevundimonas sp.]MDI1325643.1 hypothetical protein [Brevundimonas sp.]
MRSVVSQNRDEGFGLGQILSRLGAGRSRPAVGDDQLVNRVTFGSWDLDEHATAIEADSRDRLGDEEVQE